MFFNKLNVYRINVLHTTIDGQKSNLYRYSRYRVNHQTVSMITSIFKIYEIFVLSTKGMQWDDSVFSNETSTFLL